MTNRFTTALDILLRVPPVFVMDTIFIRNTKFTSDLMDGMAAETELHHQDYFDFTTEKYERNDFTDLLNVSSTFGLGALALTERFHEKFNVDLTMLASTSPSVILVSFYCFGMLLP